MSEFSSLLVLRGLTPFDSEKEKVKAELENIATTANNALQIADTMLTNLKAQTKAKKDELKGPFLKNRE